MRRKSFGAAYIVLFVGFAVAYIALFRDQPLSFDANGFAHGTGERAYKYKSGAMQLREDYVDGRLVRSRWFKPDGSLIQETHWVNGSGEGIYLREDGSIRTRMQYVNDLAEGRATEYDEAGNVTKIMQYRAGQCVAESAPTSTQPTP